MKSKVVSVISILLSVVWGGTAWSGTGDAFDSTFAMTTADTVSVTPGWLPSGTTPLSLSIFNWTDGETLLINFRGVVPARGAGPSINSFPLIGPNSYIVQSSAPDSVILWVPDDSITLSVHWIYRD